MAKEVAILVSCDLCKKGRGDGTDIVEDVPVKSGKQERELDLCADCKATLDEIMAPYLHAGRRPNGSAPTGTKQQFSVRLSEYDMTRCPYPACDDRYAGSESLRKHLSRTHRVLLKEALTLHPDKTRKTADTPKPEATMPCPECAEAGTPRLFDRVQGLGAHRRAAHGVVGVTAKPVKAVPTKKATARKRSGAKAA